MYTLPIEILIAWLLADLITGIFHWFEDRYLDESTSLEFFQSVALENANHHTKPTAMCLVSWWENMRSAAVFAWPTAALLACTGCPTWLWLGVGFSAFGNLIHRFAHEPRKRIGPIIRFMQWTGLFISREHHDRHHYWDNGGRVDPKWNAYRTYCPMTNWVNPVLDRIGFWWFLESILAKFGIHVLQERS